MHVSMIHTHDAYIIDAYIYDGGKPKRDRGGEELLQGDSRRRIN